MNNCQKKAYSELQPVEMNVVVAICYGENSVYIDLYIGVACVACLYGVACVACVAKLN